jgi:DNA-binding response OmpR family regulator
MKVLLAEDDASISIIIQTRLKHEGYTVIAVSDGREAINAIEIHQPDLIITDILMPYTSGLELIGIVRSNTENYIPVIVLSAMGQEDTVIEAFKMGADDFLTKPFTALELSTRVKRFAVKGKIS